MGINVSRRSLLGAMPLVGVAISAPAVEAAEARPTMTPDERIEAAIAEIAIAFREKWPNCPIRVDDCDNQTNGMVVIISHCGSDAQGAFHHRRTGTARLTV